VSEQLLEEVAALPLHEVGRSGGGRPLWAGRFGSGAGRPLLIVAGVHGDEPSSTSAAVELCQALITSPPRLGPVWVMPAMNPDGLVAGRKNSSRDVDLNRNFPSRNFSPEHKPGYFPGEAPMSEPETRALVELCERVAAEGVVAVHAPFACVNYDGPAADWAASIAEACGWPVRESIGYPTPGSLGSWLGVDRGQPVITLELPPGAYAAFRAPAQAALQTAINRERIR
jgi:murein peptide amidase A